VINLSERIGDYVETYTGKQFWPLEPRPEDVCIEDIAHSLSMQCRFNGHCSRFYSVAEHSVKVSIEMLIRGYDKQMRLYGLLHDAAEAYCCDIPRPLKSLLKGYGEMEDHIQQVIWQAFGLPEPTISQYKIIKHVDNCYLRKEGTILMPNTDDWVSKIVDWDPVYIDIYGLSQSDSKKQFIQIFEELKR